MCLQLKKITTVFLFQLFAIWLWGLRNNYLFYNLLQFLTFVLYWFPTKNLDSSWTIGQTGRIFFSAEDYTNMSYYELFLLKTTQIWVITIVVVLDQSTVTFQKGWGYYNLCGIEIKIVVMLCFISWLIICRVCSHPRRFSISITNQ
jgi:hypothetical protein